MTDHPCFSCSLPDCDDTSRRCGLRVANRRYEQARKKGQITPELKELHRIVYREFWYHTRLEKREQERAARKAVAQ